MTAPFPALTKTYHHGPYSSIDPKLPELSADGKVAIVTGGGGGIGSAIAKALAKAGVKHVALLGRKLESLTIAKTKIDSDYPTTKKFRAEVDQPVDILISNAGYLSAVTQIADADVGDWVACINTNVIGSFYVAKEFISICSPSASIVNVASAAAHVQVPGLSAYSCAKIAGVKLFEFLHSEHPQLRVFNLHPGMIDSDMNRRSGMPPLDDVNLAAHVTVWLCSSQADFLRGKFFWSNWDVDELRAKAKQLESTSLITLSLEGWPFVDGN